MLTLVQDIAERLRGIALDDATTTERQIFTLLRRAGIMQPAGNEHDAYMELAPMPTVNMAKVAHPVRRGDTVKDVPLEVPVAWIPFLGHHNLIAQTSDGFRWLFQAGDVP